MTHHKFLKKFHGQSVHLNIFEDFTWWGIVALNVIETHTHTHTHTHTQRKHKIRCQNSDVVLSFSLKKR